jgi:hypothetical protein
LIFFPSGIAQFLNVCVGGACRVFGDQFDVNHESALGGRQARFIEFAFEDCCDALIGGSLNTQEEGVAVQSIRAAIQKGNVTGDHFLVAAGEMAFGEVKCIGEFNDLAEEIGTRSETSDDAGKLLAAGARAPEIVSGGEVAGGVGVFGDMDFGVRLFPSVAGIHG